MELLNGEIFVAKTALEQLFEIDLPVRTSMDLAKLIGKVTEAWNAIEKVRTGLVTKYGSEDPETRQKRVAQDSEEFTKFIEEYNELMEQKTELVFDIVRLPQNVDGKPLVIKPALLVNLLKFVEVEPLTVVK